MSAPETETHPALAAVQRLRACTLQLRAKLGETQWRDLDAALTLAESVDACVKANESVTETVVAAQERFTLAVRERDAERGRLDGVLFMGGLCAASDSCEGHCGYVHLQGCAAIREYLAEHGGPEFKGRPWAVKVDLEARLAKAEGRRDEALEALRGLLREEWCTYEGNLEASGHASIDDLERAREVLAKTVVRT